MKVVHVPKIPAKKKNSCFQNLVSTKDVCHEFLELASYIHDACVVGIDPERHLLLVIQETQIDFAQLLLQNPTHVCVFIEIFNKQSIVKV